MSRKNKAVFVVEVVVMALIVGVQITHAAPRGYIDPGTGGMLFQVLAIVLTTLSGFVFLFSNRIKMMLARSKRSDDDAIEGEETTTLLAQIDGDEDEDEKGETLSPATK
jgi:hypothetical protein